MDTSTNSKMSTYLSPLVTALMIRRTAELAGLLMCVSQLLRALSIKSCASLDHARNSRRKDTHISGGGPTATRFTNRLCHDKRLLYEEILQFHVMH